MGRRRRCTRRLPVAVLVVLPITVLMWCATRADAVARSGWSIQSLGVRTGVLYGVSCASPTACTAVGWFVDPAGDGVPLTERWNGRSWSIQPASTRVGWRNSAFFGVSCPSPRACTAVGELTDRSDIGLPLVEHWDGLRWSIQPLGRSVPSGPYDAPLNAVSCSSPESCTAVGEGDQGLGVAQRWTGGSWTLQQLPMLPTDTSSLNGVSCAAAAACMSVGYFEDLDTGQDVPLVEQWDGSAWTRTTTPVPPGSENALMGAACMSATACAAVGFRTRGFRTPHRPLAMRGVADDWRLLPTPSLTYLLDPWGSETGELDGVSCSVPSACIAVGSVAADLTPARPLVERWNGKRWARRSVPRHPRAGKLAGVSCVSRTACIAVGEDDSRGDDSPAPLLERTW